MRIKSKAGNFHMTIEEVAAENGELVLTGKMGVWQAKTYMSVDDLRDTIAGVKIQGNVLDFLALAGFRYLRGLMEQVAPEAPPTAATPDKTTALRTNKPETPGGKNRV